MGGAEKTSIWQKCLWLRVFFKDVSTKNFTFNPELLEKQNVNKGGCST